MIEWEKMGRLFVPSGEGHFKTHATRPVPYRLDASTLRIFFSSRDGDDRMLPTFIDVDVRDPARVLRVNERPLLDVGAPGAFDDSGVTVGSVIDRGDETYVYYTGWKRRRVVSFELTIGLARWDRATDTFVRVFEGPILPQDRHHPYLTAGPFVLEENGLYKMWFCSGRGWRFPDQNPEPLYSPHYAESRDGIDWVARPGPVLPASYDGEVISAPWVVRAGGDYHMWFSTRGHETREAKNYHMGYARSTDGVAWTRNDGVNTIDKSPTGWDSEMVCYPAFHGFEDRTYMFYCGNAVGRGGIGWAVSTNFLEGLAR